MNYCGDIGDTTARGGIITNGKGREYTSAGADFESSGWLASIASGRNSEVVVRGKCR